MRFWGVMLRAVAVMVVALCILYLLVSVMCGGMDFTEWPKEEREGYAFIGMALAWFLPVFLMRR